MVLGLETAWGQAGQITWATFDFINAVTLATVEVVMVVEMGDFVAGLAAGHVDGGEFLLRQQCLDRTIDGGDAEPWGLVDSGLEDFVRRHWSLGSDNRGADRVALTSVSFDGHGRDRSRLPGQTSRTTLWKCPNKFAT